MQVILLEEIQKLGGLGDLVNVKSGYARNYLVPQNKAKPATEANLAEFEATKAELFAKASDTLSAAKYIQEKMTNTTCTIAANASDDGKLFGSVSAADIVKSLAVAGFDIEKRNINMPDAIRTTGEFEVSINLHTGIDVALKVVVRPTNEPSQIEEPAAEPAATKTEAAEAKTTNDTDTKAIETTKATAKKPTKTAKPAKKSEPTKPSEKPEVAEKSSEKPSE